MENQNVVMQKCADPGLPVGCANPVKRGNRAGFSLVELLIALMILAIISAIALPAYTKNVRKGHQVEAQRILTSLAQTEEIYRFQYGSYTANISPNLTNLGWVNDSAGSSVGVQYYPTANIVVVPGIPPTTFVATATGAIGGSQNDVWTIDQNGTLTNTQNGT